jgi:GntR family transcriptional repressor for pyruvate dehydrogenase complex
VAATTGLVDRIRTQLPELATPDGRLPSERALSELLEVSRPALREAMRRLVDLGLVEATRGSGAFLVRPDLEELLVVRRALEPVAAHLAARHATDDERGQVGRLAAQLARAQRYPERFAALDLELHRAVAQASHNRVLIACLDDLDQMMRASRAQTAGDPATRQATLDDLQKLSAAIVAGRGPAADAAMRSHLDRIAQTLTRGRRSEWPYSAYASAPTAHGSADALALPGWSPPRSVSHRR